MHEPLEVSKCKKCGKPMIESQKLFIAEEQTSIEIKIECKTVSSYYNNQYPFDDYITSPYQN